MSEESAEANSYIFDAGPNMFEENILRDVSPEFATRYFAASAPVLPLVAELERAGFKVNILGDLVKAGAVALPVFDILKRWFIDSNNSGIRADILQVLSQPWARDHAFDFLIERYRSIGFSASDDEKETQSAIGVVLVERAQESDFEILLELLRQEYGTGRSMLLYHIGKFRKRKVELVPVLIEALNASLWEAGGAIHALGDLRAVETRDLVSTAERWGSDWVAAEIKKTLKKFDTAQARKARRELS
jgi:hypothetical protein